MAENRQSFDDLIGDLESLKIKGPLQQELMQEIGKQELEVIKRAFERETSPSGEKWKSLDFNYKKWKMQKVGNAKILQFNGVLENSFSLEVVGDQVSIKSSSSVAVLHQEGLNGLPKREFMGIDEEFERDIVDFIKSIWEKQWK